MAFANLFTGLSMDQHVTHSGAGERKRRSQAELRGPDSKKQGYEAQSSWTYKPFRDDDSTEHLRTGFSKDLMHNHSDNSGHNNMHHKGQNAKKNYQQQQQNNQGDGRRNQHHQKDRGGFPNRGGHFQTRFDSRKFGGQGKRQDNKQEFKVPPTRVMTQEFREQNGLLVDGQLLCRHFMWGRCIKGDKCQLKHIQGSNDIIKEVCKYYVQGACTKGESCPYMHKQSFPCKFFHRKGKCSHGADCNFSHDPLNETTSRLLEEVLKQDKLYELSKTDEQKSSGQPANTDETEMTESKKTPDVLTQPLRPIFYNSGEPKTEQEDLLCKTEEQREIPETAVPPEASDTGSPHSPLSTHLNPQEPVCYSVEAVLRPQLFKPFPSFFTTPGSQDYASLSGPQNSSDCTSGSADQSKAPYSVDVVRSCKSEASFIVGQISSPPIAQYVSYLPKTDREQRTDPLLSSNTDKVLYSTKSRNEANKSQEKKFKCLPSLHTYSDLISKTCPDLTVASGDDKKHVGEEAASLKSLQRASHEVKSELFYPPATVAEKSALSYRKGDLQRSPHLPVKTLHSVDCTGEGVFPFAPTKLKSQTFNPPQMRPYLSVQTSKSRASAKPLRPSSGFSVFKDGAAVPSEPVPGSAETNSAGNSAVHHLRAKQPTETHEPSNQLQLILEPGTQRPNSSEATAECSSNMEHCGDSSLRCSKTFCSLFASPITDSQKLTPDFGTTSASLQSSRSAPLFAHSRSEDYHVKPVDEPDPAFARLFLSLFSTPLRAAPLPCKETQPDYSRTACTSESSQLSDNVPHSSDSNQRASNAETPHPCPVKTSHRPTSPKFSPRLKNEDDLSEAVSQPPKQQVNPACREISSSQTPCGDRAGSSTTQTHHWLPDISSPKAGATSTSVLKTLFLYLSPFEEAGEKRHSAHISLPSESVKKEQSSSGDVFVQPQRKRKKKRRKKKTPYSQQQSTEKSVAHSTEHQTSSQTSLISVEATVGSTFSAPARTEPEVRNSGTHNLPFRPVTQLTQHHVRPRLKNNSEEGKWGNGKVSVTPFKDLFKSLDTTVFNLGH